ncbi:MAG: hypothetical protein AAB906_02500 [Patescibacteria group bacterium]
MITVKQRNELIKIYGESNKNVSTNKIIEIAKVYNIGVIEIEKYFKWIENSYLYMVSQNEINNINSLISTFITNTSFKHQYLMISPPEIS